ncbi:DUF397 domain-containing protein [Phytomonospora sp. NPDC050363]|uniref:DUF397 domain-containing protein n=1 Tax=Phytomonospora sp. NPDC050363 TaxID=3155642 RepID=UPI0033E95264
MKQLAWRKSSRSDSNAGQCVEVAGLPHGIAVRDSKDRSGPVLVCDPAAWAGFLAGLAGPAEPTAQ